MECAAWKRLCIDKKLKAIAGGPRKDFTARSTLSRLPYS